ncbi:MAG: hypothetical protein ACJ8F7_14950 [Gemmataceae bacterium]
MLSSFAAALLVLAPGQSPEPPPFVKEYARAVPYYYKSPDPALGPKMLKELLKEENLRHPLFTKDNNYVLMLNAAVLGDIARGQPKVVREYEDAYADASPAGRKVIVRALENCGDGDTVKWIGDRTELAALKAQLEDPKHKHIRDRPAKTPDDLDLLWVNFFITGEYAPISRILDVFDQPDAKENEVMKRVARWSFGSNVQQHPKLVEVVMKHKGERAQGSKKVIDQTIITAP